MELFEAIKSRRSIRRYTADPVDDKQIEAILEAGTWAPSWANTQCWRFIVVRDQELRTKVAATLTNLLLQDAVWINPAFKALTTAPVIIVVCAEIGKSGYRHGETSETREPATDKGDWFMFDTALAVENMVLAAHALGLGTVIIGAFDAEELKEILSVPDGFRVVTFFPVGVPAREPRTPPRKPLVEIVSHDGWVK
jgi:nitroreductase